MGYSISLIQGAKADLANTNIVIKANIVANTCRVSPDSINQFVDLGVWATKNFKQKESTEPVKFTLNLTDCSVTTTGVKVTFNGEIDGQDNTLFKLTENDSAKNIAIAILDKNKDKLLPGQSSILYPVGTNNNLALDFYAQYTATGQIVTGGSANGEVLFALEYL
ncbi:type 1 fimbrae adaptor subunit [Proteus hauseri ATCC 700826]|uniref:Type 1 fimbrae adaptor subunit n=2 Tax=Proteus hauseri TaxID=183417 RepID=A0AAJ3HSH2_PROHU|nr:type 1 fimbrae adaptor subunit [Proteus hauseri ATCC 700826]